MKTLTVILLRSLSQPHNFKMTKGRGTETQKHQRRLEYNIQLFSERIQR